MGAKKKPKYRIVVTDEQKKRGGGFIEILGNYNPITDPPDITIKQNRYDHWISVGAQPTKSVLDLHKRYEKTDRVSS